jgi:hypothetical protein
MRDHECDQLAVDTIEAERRAVDNHHVAIHLKIGIVESLVAFVARRYAYGDGGEDFEALLDFALDRFEPYDNDAQRDGYKIALGLIFNRRKMARDSQLREHERVHPID